MLAPRPKLRPNPPECLSKPKITNCPNCGAVRIHNSFCEYCGTGFVFEKPKEKNEKEGWWRF